MTPNEPNDLVRRLSVDIKIPPHLGMVEGLEEYFKIINTEVARGNTIIAELRKENLHAHRALGFFASAIKSGEPWSPACQEMLDGTKSEESLAKERSDLEQVIRENMREIDEHDTKMVQIPDAEYLELLETKAMYEGLCK
jgi:hypothetical protein